MAEWSRRGLAAGVAGAGCTLRLDPALYGVTGIAKSRSGRQLQRQASSLRRQTLHRAAEVGGKAGRPLLLSAWLYSCFFLPEVTDFRPCRETCNEFCNGSRVPRRAPEPRAPRAAPSRPGQRLATPRRHGVHQWRGAELQRPAASGGSRQAQSIRECFSGAAPGFRSAALSGQHGPIACLGRLLLPNVVRARLVAS